MSVKRVAIVGAGISGASLARVLADHGVESLVVESGLKAGGMARETIWNGALVSELGPHIFRTNNKSTWDFISRFAAFEEIQHNVLTVIGDSVRPFPPLLVGGGPPPEVDLAKFSSVGDYLLSAVGKDLFHEYYESYTLKRWAVSPFELSPDMIPLVPVSRSDRGFFSHSRIGCPTTGFTRMIENMLDHESIRTIFGTIVTAKDLADYDVLVWTGRLDQLGSSIDLELPYQCVRQEFEVAVQWPLECASVINYPGSDVPYIRRTNYGRLLPWKPAIVGSEYSGSEGYPAYPVRTNAAVRSSAQILETVRRETPRVIPHGRLGRFDYMSMDQAVDRSIILANRLTHRSTC